MKIKFRENNVLDILIWLLLGFYTLIAHWIWFGRGIQESLVILLAVAVLVSRIGGKISREAVPELVLGVLFVLFVFCGIGNADNHNYLIEDMKSMCGGAFLFLYLMQFYEKRREQCLRYMELSRKILTIYMWLNSVIIILQSKIPYFLMNTYAIQSVNNDMYEDQLTGFLGINGTTRWNIVTCVVVILNLVRASKKKDMKLWVSTILLALVSVYVSALSSTRSFLIILPMYVVVYFFCVKQNSVRGWMKYVMLAMVAFLVLFGIYVSNPMLNAYVNDLIADKVRIYFSGDFSYMVAANDDRVVALNYALNHGGMLGSGIGEIPMHYADEEVKYLGLNSTSIYVYMIGVLGYLVCTLFYARVGLRGKELRKRNIMKFAMVGVFLILSYFLPVYSSIILMFGMGMINIGFAMEESNE